VPFSQGIEPLHLGQVRNISYLIVKGETAMTNKNDQLVVGLYANEQAARDAIDKIKKWDKQEKDIKLGAIAAITYNAKKDKLEYIEKGQRSTKSGAGGGTALGAAVAILSGGVALIPGMVAGAAAGGLLGSLNHKSLGITDEQKQKIMDALKEGGAGLGVMADDFEVDAIVDQMAATGGDVSHYRVDEEVAAAITEAAAAQVAAEEAVDEAAEEVDEEEVTEASKAVEAEVPDLEPEQVQSVSKIAAVTGLSTEGVAKLHDAGVDKPSALLAACATPESREELSAETGIDNDTILTAAKKLDLMRVNGVGIKYATLLLASGVDTVPELATRNDANLAKKMAEVNAKEQIVKEVPSADTVAGWIAHAKALPRMLYY
jgi:uncharacterized membrane protein/predicted flap endonuclease-1-like 5' DNA nuclease